MSSDGELDMYDTVWYLGVQSLVGGLTTSKLIKLSIDWSLLSHSLLDTEI